MSAGFKDARFYSRSGRILAIVVAAIGVLGVFGFFSTRGAHAGAIAALVVLIVVALLYLLLWRPRLEVRDAGVLVVNPLRSHRLDWASILSVEIRWALTITTTTGPITVWAVPRPSRGSDPLGMRTDAYKLPDYQAEKLHEQQDGSSRVDNAALRVIQSRLNNR
jgi:hypothetical protein